MPADRNRIITRKRSGTFFQTFYIFLFWPFKALMHNYDFNIFSDKKVHHLTIASLFVNTALDVSLVEITSSIQTVDNWHNLEYSWLRICLHKKYWHNWKLRNSKEMYQYSCFRKCPRIPFFWNKLSIFIRRNFMKWCQE